MAASRPRNSRLSGHIVPLTTQTPADGTHSVRIMRGTHEVCRELAPTRTAALLLQAEMLDFFRRFARAQRRRRDTP